MALERLVDWDIQELNYCIQSIINLFEVFEGKNIIYGFLSHRLNAAVTDKISEIDI